MCLFPSQASAVAADNLGELAVQLFGIQIGKSPGYVP